jgi:hypothetical protein
MADTRRSALSGLQPRLGSDAVLGGDLSLAALEQPAQAETRNTSNGSSNGPPEIGVIHRHRPSRSIYESPARWHFLTRPITARQARSPSHNPKVTGSNPVPATKEGPGRSQDPPGPSPLSGADFLRIFSMATDTLLGHTFDVTGAEMLQVQAMSRDLTTRRPAPRR